MLLVMIAIALAMAIMISVPSGIMSNEASVERLTDRYNTMMRQTESEINQTANLIECSYSFRNEGLYLNDSDVSAIRSMANVSEAVPKLTQTWTDSNKSYSINGVPLTTEFIDGLRFSQAQELDWGQTAEAAGVRIEAVPVKHWGSRYPWDHDRGYNGLLLTKNKRSILFGGDTAYTERLAAATNGRPVDVVILPIGGYNPYIANHASPEQAWDLFHEMRARYLVPMHWRTFRMSRERPFEPCERLSSGGNGLASRIALHTIGETWTLPA
jgi:ribonuclease BN (tRNA processing enzyme)